MLQIVAANEDGSAEFPRPTAREIEILKLVANGLTGKEIGGKLDISPRTVQKHLDHICAKLNARNRTHLVAIAVAIGWIEREVVIRPSGGRMTL